MRSRGEGPARDAHTQSTNPALTQPHNHSRKPPNARRHTTFGSPTPGSLVSLIKHLPALSTPGADTRPPSPLQTAADPGGEKSPERQIPAGLFTQRGGGGRAGYWGPTDWEPQLRLGQPQLCSLRTAHKHPSAPPHPRCTPVRVSPPLHTLFTNISIRLSKSFTRFHTRGCDTTHKCFHTSAPSHVFHVWLQFKSPFMPRFSQSIFKSPFARCTRVLSHILRSSVPFNVSKNGPLSSPGSRVSLLRAGTDGMDRGALSPGRTRYTLDHTQRCTLFPASRR